MDIAQETIGEVLVIAPKGRLDTETSGELELALHDAFEGGKFHFLIDLSNIGYVSSAGLRVLLSIAKKLESGVGSIRLAGLNPTVKQVFDLSGFTSLFKMSATRADALKIMPQAQVATPKPAAAAPAAASAPAPAKPAAPAVAPVVSTPAAPARTAADLLGGGAKPAGSPSDMAASLLGLGKPAAAPAAPAPVRANLEQATNLLMPSVKAALATTPEAQAAAVAAPAPAAPAPAAAPAPVVQAPVAPAQVAAPKPAPTPAPAADKPASPAAPAKKGSWSKLFKE